MDKYEQFISHSIEDFFQDHSKLYTETGTKMREDSGRMTKQYLSDVRLCVTGGSSVGKSAITVRFLTRRFIGEYQRDVEQTYRGFIDFGPDTIKYDLKDTARSPDKSFFSTWPTCIAVIYSINDIASFATASKLLDDIDTSLRQAIDCNNCTPSIALIGNKSDLEHLRNVREEEGRNLADKHGATFWEASASEDYYSTFRPLTSLIVKSFLSSKNGSSPNSSSPSSSGNEDKTPLSSMKDEDINNLLRRYSEPCNNTPRIITAPRLAAEYQRKQSDDVITRNLAPTSSPIRNTIKRRKKLREKSKSFDRDTKTSSSESSTPTTLTTPNGDVVHNITIEVTDTNGEAIQKRGKSLNDKKRFIQRKGNGYKQNCLSANMGGEKSQSFTDLKTLQSLNAENDPGLSSANSEMTLCAESDVNLNKMGRSNSHSALARSQSMRYCKSNTQLNGNSNLNVNSVHRSSSVRHAASVGRLNEKESLKEQLKSISTTSFSALEDNKNNKNLWSRIRKDRRKLLNLSIEDVYDDSSETNDKLIESVGELGKKSVRRRISSIFRPRSMNGSPD